MKEINQVFAKVLPVLFIAALMTSCASIHTLKVRYQLPPASDRFKGKKVFLTVKDTRSEAVFIGRGAKRDFANFPGNVLFSVARQNEPGLRIGIYEPAEMIREGFKRRLENMGMEVIPERSQGEPELVIRLNEFLLDLANQRWIAKMEFEATLYKDGKVLATQTISGQAERFKLIGRSEADIAVGEIFTDAVNRLDVFKLFQQARLLNP